MLQHVLGNRAADEVKGERSMQKALIYGAGGGGTQIYRELVAREEPYEIVAFVDRLRGGTEKEGLPVIFPNEMAAQTFDIVFVATQDNTVRDTLVREYGIPDEKINTARYWNSAEVAPRVRALEHFRELCDMYGMKGSVAEVGVFQGDFSKHINRLFPESKLYLYDTFEGFSERDKAQETPDAEVTAYTHYANTSVDLVMKKMAHPDQIVVCKGMFPETATGADDKYVFVSLDPDLYAPVLAGLEYFYPRLVHGGAIFVHDFFSNEDPGVRRAVTEFLQKEHIAMTPIGDFRTLAIVKPL